MVVDYRGLELFDNFILWNLKFNEKLQDWTKVPLDWRTGLPCDPGRPNSRTDFEQIAVAAKSFNAGIGYYLTREDPFFFIDIDEAFEDGELRPECREVRDHFPGAFVSRSQSGRGLHIIGSCDVTRLPSNRRCKAKKYDLSFDAMFTESRFIALTENEATGSVFTDLTANLVDFVGERLVDDSPGMNDFGWTTAPIEGPGLSDMDVIEKAMKSTSVKAGFGHSARFADLWEGNADVLGHFWPDDKGSREYDASRADSALAQHLAFWTGGNCEQIERIMRMSPGLARDKWDLREDYYLPRTILRVVKRQGSFYRGYPDLQLLPPPPPSSDETADLPVARLVEETGVRYLKAREQLNYFDGCVYIASEHRVLTRDCMLLKPDAFRALYGGYGFEIDMNGKTTDNAFRAFTESQLVDFPKVADMFFDPSLPPRTIVDGRVNTYRRIEVDAREGDISLFLMHMEKIMPSPEDREILLDYMAACVQRPGDKFQWCPMIQGTEGNGKTVLARILRNAIGDVYFHQEDPEDLKNIFNAWLERSIIVSVEEIFINNRYEMSNRMKAMLTNDYVPLHSKGVDQRSAHNCAKFILFSNHKDGVYKHANDRRYAIFYTAQQTRDDCMRDGMDNGYFRALYDWVNSGEGKAALNWFLMHREIHTDMMGTAPETSSTGQAIFESLGPEERILLEAIEDECPGLRNGILAGPYIDDILRQSDFKNRGPKHRNKVLSNIGYRPAGKLSIDSRRIRVYTPVKSPLSGLKLSELRDLYLRYNHAVQ